MNELLARRKLTETCKMLYDRNLTVSAGGNMSVRLGEDRFLITPSGRNKGLLNPEDMVLINSKGRAVSDGKPSIEHKFHLALYAANPDVGAVVHCHPLHCVALAVSGRSIRCGLTPEGVILLGDAPLIGYFTPGSKELVEAVRSNSGSRAMLLERHGAITQGRDLEEAFNRMEELEFQAKLQFLVGDAEDLPAKEIAKLRKM
ncbi:MAG: class II aldolase/adducin family protein [Candidatus Methanoplasma sp.]|jgi:L-fuculose-phosphate aldolase|nr:class II aldolase/adducin family protein [Candidatus Methanoplasma sp.]